MYILIGLIIVLIIVIIYFFAFPGIFLINSNIISGYWMDLLGRVYHITPTGKQSFNVKHNGINKNGIIKGTLLYNTINIENKNLIGIYNIKMGTIIFSDGTEWYKNSY